MIMTDNLIYEERVSSNRTAALFSGLTILFLLLSIWRMSTGSPDILSATFLFFFVFFLFYSVNYRTLTIRLSPESLKLKFGIFTWTLPLENVGECRFDDLPALMKFGGAGVHFMFVRKRYRASFNFLEHPRVVIALVKKVGIVQDISFSTRRPDEIIQLLLNTVSVRGTAQRLSEADYARNTKRE
jgi:hypothetical protein